MPFFDQYPYTNFHNVNLDWVLERVKEWGQMVENNNTRFENLERANEDFKEYVTTYLENLNVQESINIKLDEMLDTGVLAEYLQPYVSNTVTTWLEQNITEPEGIVIDSSLTVDGAVADAGATGRAIDDLKPYILSDAIKNNILALFRKVYYETGADTEYYRLYNSFFGERQPVNNYDVLSMKGFTLQSISSDGTITFSAFNNGSAFVFSPDVTQISGDITFNSNTYQYGRLFIFRIVDATTLYGILSKNLVILRLNTETSTYTVTVDNTIAEFSAETGSRRERFVNLVLNNGNLYGYKKDDSIDFTVNNANCIGFWANNSTGIPSVTLKRNTIVSRKLKISDIDTSYGFEGIEINEGVLTYSSVKTFSAITLNVKSIRSRLSFSYNGTIRYANLIVYRKNADGTLFAASSSTLYLLTYDETENRYRASTMENSDVLVSPTGDRTGGFFHAVLKDNTLYCFNAQMGLLYIINNSNCIGIYSALNAGQLDTFDCEVRVYD